MAQSSATQSFAAAQSPVKYNADMNGRMSFASAPTMSFTSQHSQSQSSANGHKTSHSPFRGLNDSGQPSGPPFHFDKPQIYTAVYSGVKVYEMEVNGVACMRRRADGWLNATQILKVAGIDKGKRTKVLEKEVLTGLHEKVQGGYGKYQGTWISYERGREFCRQYGVEDVLQPLLDYDRTGDGETTGTTQDTPTKEQAMAANRKRFYNAGGEQRNGANPAQNGTFFSSISPMSSVALSAMEKAARLNASDIRPGTNGGSFQRPSLPTAASQQSIMSDHSFSADLSMDSGFIRPSGDEPPRKRMRTDGEANMAMAIDVSMQSATPTEPNGSFLYGAVPEAYEGPPITLSPLPTPDSPELVEKRNMLLDLFADQSRIDYTTHPALTQLGPEDYDLPLDASANTALHWAATLARVPLVKLLLQKGANMWRGNAAGQSPLISAVLVNNCSEHSCFASLLELLSPLIEVRDAQGRTILHHIAVACGIKGRAPSSKYYLEALLEFLVRSATNSSGDTNQEHAIVNGRSGPMSLAKFLSTIVNAQDKGGNTALNLVARIGNRSIIQQLLEIRADPTLPNHKGVSAKDFGVGVDEDTSNTEMMSFSQSVGNAVPLSQSVGQSQVTVADGDETMSNVNILEEQNQDVIKSLTSLLQSNLANHKNLLSQKLASIDCLTAQIQELSAQQTVEEQRFSDLQARQKARTERQRKIENLSRVLAATGAGPTPPSSHGPVDASKADADIASTFDLPPSITASTSETSLEQLQHISLSDLQAIERAYGRNNAKLEDENAALRGKSLELESLYRRVISLCTGVAEAKIDELLPGLVAAVESEGSSGAAGANQSQSQSQSQSQPHTHASSAAVTAAPSSGGMGGLGVGRVREFLALVDGVNGASASSQQSAATAPSAAGVGAGAAAANDALLGLPGAASQLVGIGAFAASSQGSTAQARTSQQQQQQSASKGRAGKGRTMAGHNRAPSAVMVEAV